MVIHKLQKPNYYKSKHIIIFYNKKIFRFITQESHKLTKQQVQVPKGLTGAVSWRSEDIKHRKNEVFLDVIESINLLVASNGNLLRSEIVGCIKMRSYLSGMPELRLGLNDRVQFESTGRCIYIIFLLCNCIFLSIK